MGAPPAKQDSVPGDWRTRSLGLGVLLLVCAGALLWARARDPLTREWFQLRAEDGRRFECVLVRAKAPDAPGAPVLIYCHGAGGSLTAGGNDIRQLVRTGCQVLALEYDQQSFERFAGQVAAAQAWLLRQPWADTNRIVWVGMSLGAQYFLSLALRTNSIKPALLARIVGGLPSAIPGEEAASGTPVRLDFPVLLFQAENDQVFELADGRQVAERLRALGGRVELIVMPGLSHNLEGDRAQAYRLVGERILACLGRIHPAPRNRRPPRPKPLGGGQPPVSPGQA